MTSFIRCWLFCKKFPFY